MKARNLFLSLEARGKFGDIAIANIIRGIQIIKKKMDPANPKTPGQKKQRQIYADARNFYNSLRLTERDKTAISRLSRLFKKKLNSFQFFFLYYYYSQLGNHVVDFASQTISLSPSIGTLHLSCESRSGINMTVNINRKFNWNATKYPMVEIPGTGKYLTTIPDLISREKYYFYFSHVAAPVTEPFDSGIYFERTK